MLEQWHIASLFLGAAGCFWLGYWARGSEDASIEQRDETEQRVGWPL